jgi:hypothetical protein
MDRYPQLDQMNRTGEILKYLDVMRYKRGMDAYTRKRNAELDAERNKQNALQRSVTNIRTACRPSKHPQRTCPGISGAHGRTGPTRTPA